jgi:MFS family permease
MVLALTIGGVLLLAAFIAIERRVKSPMIALELFRIRAFSAGNLANFAISMARGGLQFMLVIWLQGIWLPLHGYSYSRTPFWAGIYMLPLTIGFMVAGPISGTASDRFGSRGIATAGAFLSAVGFAGLLLLPVNFTYVTFALFLGLIGVAQGMFTSPNSSSVMGSVPARQRGVASGMRSTFINSGTAISIGVFFTLMIAGLSSHLPKTLSSGLHAAGLSATAAHKIASLPPVSSLFAAQLGINPLRHMLAGTGALGRLKPAARAQLTGRHFFPHLLTQPFHDGLIVVFATAVGLSLLASVASLLRGAPSRTSVQLDQQEAP